MPAPHNSRLWRAIAAVAIIVAALACTWADGQSGSASASAPGASEQLILIDHLAPRRDSVGRQPTRFEWTKVEGADSYAIGVWNDVETMVWRQDGIQGNVVDWPKEERLDAGTYFWSVTALKDGHAIGDSGRAAFVVRTD
jgi:hypothetical protein